MSKIITKIDNFLKKNNIKESGQKVLNYIYSLLETASHGGNMKIKKDSGGKRLNSYIIEISDRDGDYFRLGSDLNNFIQLLKRDKWKEVKKYSLFSKEVDDRKAIISIDGGMEEKFYIALKIKEKS